MDKNLLYEDISTFTEKFTYSYIQGIAEEIAEMFFRLQMEEERKVKDFALFFDYETNHYRIGVVVKDDTFSTVQSIFVSFFGFISYAGANVTASQKTAQGIRYLLASLDEQGKGFYCEVEFLPEEAETEDEEQQAERGTTAQTSGILPFSQREHPEIKWKFEMGSASYFPLLAAQDLIYSVGDEGDLYAVDARQGSLRWHWQAEQQQSKIATFPSVDQGVLAVYTSARSQFGLSEATLWALDAQTGQLLRSSPVPVLQSIGSCHLLTTRDGVAYLSGTDRNLLPSSPHSLCLALDLQTGMQKWRVDGGRHLGTTTPVVANGHLYLVTFDIQFGSPFIGYLHALDIQTGEENWNYRFETRGIQEIVVDGTEIFVAGTRVEVVDALTGMTKWNLPDLDVFRDHPFVVSDEFIYISYEYISARKRKLDAKRTQEVLLAGGPPRTGKFIAIERASKQPRWAVNLIHGRSLPEKPVLADSMLYTTWKHLDMRGEIIHATLFALDARTGQERWRFEADNLSAPLVVAGTVFIRGQEDQKEYIYALSL